MSLELFQLVSSIQIESGHKPHNSIVLKGFRAYAFIRRNMFQKFEVPSNFVKKGLVIWLAWAGMGVVEVT